MTDNIPMSIDYTNRDFYSLRGDLISRVQARLRDAGKVWSATDPADFGVVFVEAMAYVGDITNYYIDRMANESSLATATQRQSLINLANTYGYIPSGYRSAIVTVVFSNSSDQELLVPSGTQLQAQIVTTTATTQTVTQLLFTLQEDVVVSAVSSGYGIAIHGEDISTRAANQATPGDVNDISGELLGYSNGLASQSYLLQSNHVSDGSISVFVRNGDYYTKWTEVTHLADYSSTDTVYTLVTDGNNNVRVVFGNGVSGVVPTYGEPIKTVYLVGGGIEGNIPANQPFSIVKTPAISGITVTSLSALSVSADTIGGFGGEDPESNDSIRVHAPEALRTLGRAVTLKDFKSIALSTQDVGKAAAYAINPTSVNLYVSPVVSDISTDYYPGFDPSNTTVTTSWTDLQTSVQEYLVDRIQIGTYVTVLPPQYTDVILDIEYLANPEYTNAQAEAAIKYAIVYGYGYNFLDFDKTIYPEDIEASLSKLPSVRLARVINLYEDGDLAARNTLTASNGEYYVFKTDNLSLTTI